MGAKRATFRGHNVLLRRLRAQMRNALEISTLIEYLQRTRLLSENQFLTSMEFRKVCYRTGLTESAPLPYTSNDPRR